MEFTFQYWCVVDLLCFLTIMKYSVLTGLPHAWEIDRRTSLVECRRSRIYALESYPGDVRAAVFLFFVDCQKQLGEWK
ncbi:hypothetical protein [Azospirillum sp. SYSU D00513]|uniref:hypothetical protein n=1 Tax=Azospirillum sp. SYSU D00513 TaxID=2812561 RepID=UPI001A96FEB3|nr:hypothetical protein [Azospirillum sp. SYSU D00513]